MARNKHPEETVRLIMDTAQRLFMEQGYDGTSMQNIMDETGLSKGAIYHHFSSKEEIFETICRRIGEENAQRLAAVRDDAHLTGAEKLRELFRSAMLHPNQEQVVDIVPYLLDNPRFLAMHLRELFDITAPDYLVPILEEGIADGSVKAENPKELAEAILVLLDIWVNPILRPSSREETAARLRVFKSMTQAMGLDILDGEVIAAYLNFSGK